MNNFYRKRYFTPMFTLQIVKKKKNIKIPGSRTCPAKHQCRSDWRRSINPKFLGRAFDYLKHSVYLRRYPSLCPRHTTDLPHMDHAVAVTLATGRICVLAAIVQHTYRTS